MPSRSTIAGALALLAATIVVIASGLGHARAAAMLERIHSAAISAPEPAALAGDIGLALVGLAALKAGAPRCAAAAIAVGALGEMLRSSPAPGTGRKRDLLVLVGRACYRARLLAVLTWLAGVADDHLPNICPLPRRSYGSGGARHR